MPKNSQDKRDSELEQLTQQKRGSLLSEFWFFLKHNKKWWLLPLLLAFLLLGILVMLGSGSIAPFIYPLF
ncbi:MAG: DUF5989 family protein [Planctomycetota bacterium]|jgi:hypothetical protein